METALLTPKFCTLVFQAHRICCIDTSDLLKAPKTLHLFHTMPKSPVQPGLVYYCFASWRREQVWSQLYGPLRASCANMFGLILEDLSMSSVSCTCGANSSHSCSGSGKSLSVVASASMNASLNVWIAHSAALTWWLCGSTSCKSHSFLVRTFLIYFVAWLSIKFIFGLYSFASNVSNTSLYAAKMLWLSTCAMGLTRIAFVL